jgi:hypothetical protein
LSFYGRSPFSYGAQLNYQKKARILRVEALTIAQRIADWEMEGKARSWLGWSSLYEGNFIAAMEELELAEKLSERGAPKREAALLNWQIHGRTFASFYVVGFGLSGRCQGQKQTFVRPCAQRNRL